MSSGSEKKLPGLTRCRARTGRRPGPAPGAPPGTARRPPACCSSGKWEGRSDVDWSSKSEPPATIARRMRFPTLFPSLPPKLCSLERGAQVVRHAVGAVLAPQRAPHIAQGQHHRLGGLGLRGGRCGAE